MTITPQFFLRPLSLSDSELVLQGRNSAQVRPLMLTDELITPQEHNQWMSKRLSDAKRPYFIFLHNEKPIGLIGLTHLEERYGQGEWGFYLWAADAPKGAGMHMLSAFLDELFTRRHLRKLCAQVINTNEKSLHLHRKLGFAQEGVLKEQLVKSGAAMDVTLFALFDRDWRAERERFRSYLDNVGRKHDH